MVRVLIVRLPLVESISQGTGSNARNFAYTYNDAGNITTEVRNGVTTEYGYDMMGQLIAVYDPQGNAIWEYVYDRGGNILTKKKVRS